MLHEIVQLLMFHRGLTFKLYKPGLKSRNRIYAGSITFHYLNVNAHNVFIIAVIKMFTLLNDWFYGKSILGYKGGYYDDYDNYGYAADPGYGLDGYELQQHVGQYY